MDEFFDNWTVQVRKGLLELCILNALAEQERYGYDLVKTLVTVPGLGVTEGTLYPLLSRLRVAGLVSTRLEESTQGPARKYYSLTKDGRKPAFNTAEGRSTLTYLTDAIKSLYGSADRLSAFISVQRVTLNSRSTHARGGRNNSRGNSAQPVGVSTRDSTGPKRPDFFVS